MWQVVGSTMVVDDRLRAQPSATREVDEVLGEVFDELHRWGVLHHDAETEPPRLGLSPGTHLRLDAILEEEAEGLVTRRFCALDGVMAGTCWAVTEAAPLLHPELTIGPVRFAPVHTLLPYEITELIEWAHSVPEPTAIAVADAQQAAGDRWRQWSFAVMSAGEKAERLIEIDVASWVVREGLDTRLLGLGVDEPVTEDSAAARAAVSRSLSFDEAVVLATRAFIVRDVLAPGVFEAIVGVLSAGSPRGSRLWPTSG